MTGEQSARLEADPRNETFENEADNLSAGGPLDAARKPNQVNYCIANNTIATRAPIAKAPIAAIFISRILSARSLAGPHNPFAITFRR
jgi:hypothetical protein